MGRRFLLISPSWPCGVQASPLFRDSGIPTGPDDGLLVNSCLQSVVHPEMFGGGDCISFAERPLAKVGVYAVRQNPVLFHNLLAALEGKELKTFVPQREYMLIFNLGNGEGDPVEEEFYLGGGVWLPAERLYRASRLAVHAQIQVFGGAGRKGVKNSFPVAY